MRDWTAIKNKIINECLDQPLLTSLFVADFAILLFHRPPFLFSLVMMSALVGMCLFFGQKLALFDLSKFGKKAKALASAMTETKPVATAESTTVTAKLAEVKPAKAAAKPKAKNKV